VTSAQANIPPVCKWTASGASKTNLQKMNFVVWHWNFFFPWNDFLWNMSSLTRVS